MQTFTWKIHPYGEKEKTAQDFVKAITYLMTG